MKVNYYNTQSSWCKFIEQVNVHGINEVDFYGWANIDGFVEALYGETVCIWRVKSLKK
jgi:hypothetical protein